KTYDDVDLFIAPSRFMKDVCVRFGVPEKKIKVIYNFIDTDGKFFAANNQAEEKYLLYFGRLSHEKGVDNLLEAMAKIGGNLKLKIAGSGAEFKKLEDKIKRLGLDRVELLGQKFGQELINLIVDAKAVIIPSIWNENMPFSMLEAMAEGKVVIASRTGGIGEIIRDKENGFLFKYGNIDELAEKIQDLDKFDLNKIGQAAIKRVMELNETAHYRDIMEVYEKLRIKN
ncbi:MAG: glycosyltransferase family 4 protein, partial [bacterium]